MVGLLVAIALMSLSLAVALPVWRTLVQREKEEELLWRGQQYDRAIQLYRRKTAAPGAPSVDVLVEQRFLRKKYKDPITGDDFETVGVGTPNAPGTPQPQRGFGQLIGGVKSKSKKRSIKVVNGRSIYNEWEFSYVPFQFGAQPAVPQGPTQPGVSPGQTPGRSPSPFGPRGAGTSPFSRPGQSPRR
jgi:type II secretory pathway pseudopilin PulG